MSRLPSLQNAVSPVTHRASNRKVATLCLGSFGLVDAKNALRIELDDTDSDSELLQYISEGLSIIEKSTARQFHDTQWEADFVVPKQWDTGLIDLTDCTQITSIKEYATDGTETTLDSTNYAVSYVHERPYFRRTDGKYFPCGNGVSVVVVYSRGLPNNAQDTPALHAALRHYVSTAYDYSGTMTEARMKQNPAWLRALETLKIYPDYNA